MPELAEVEVIKLSLSPVVSSTIIDVIVNNPNLRYKVEPSLAQKLVGNTIIAIERRSKYLTLHLTNNLSLIVHLGMTGQFKIENQDYAFRKHDHIVIKLNGSNMLVYNDSRRFGCIFLSNTSELISHKLIKNLGPEPLTEDFNKEYLYNKLKKRNTNIKAVIMNSDIVVGVGNIYANEALFNAKISPLRPALLLSEIEIEHLVNAIKMILHKAIKLGGSSIKDFISSIGHKGNFQDQFLVYGKTNQACPYNCGGLIIRIRQNNRSSFYCGKCQS